MTEIGIFVVPYADGHEAMTAQVLAADEAGLDYAAVQDHPYQRRFLDTWTLLAHLAAQTRQVRLVPDVLNLPLRLPAMIAKAAMSLDLLSGGRVEIGLGAGAYWDAIEAMGGPRRTPKESVDAVEEALPTCAPTWRANRRSRSRGTPTGWRGPSPVHCRLTPSGCGSARTGPGCWPSPGGSPTDGSPASAAASSPTMTSRPCRLGSMTRLGGPGGNRLRSNESST